jgi:hypothetical protein
MIVRFTKGDGKPDTLTCIRDDGSRTWSPVGAGVGVEHDLTHYAVETTLGFREAFLGMLEAGRDIADFGTKDGRKDTYPREALVAECLVGLVQISISKTNPLTVAEIQEQLTAVCANSALGAPGIADFDIDRVRETLLGLITRWHSLPPGSSMELPFPSSEDAADLRLSIIG